MPQLNHFEIMKTCYESERQRVLAKARELARELESSAKMIAKAAEEGDLNRIAWLTRSHDAELATRSTVLHENLHMIVGLEAQTQDAVADGDDRCYCESLAQQKRPGPCKVCKRTSLAESLLAKAGGKCHQDVNANTARCAVHGAVPDWSGELPNYKGPAGWICPEGGLFKQDFTSKAKP